MDETIARVAEFMRQWNIRPGEVIFTVNYDPTTGDEDHVELLASDVQALLDHARSTT